LDRAAAGTAAQTGASAGAAGTGLDQVSPKLAAEIAVAEAKMEKLDEQAEDFRAAIDPSSIRYPEQYYKYIRNQVVVAWDNELLPEQAEAQGKPTKRHFREGDGWIGNRLANEAERKNWALKSYENRDKDATVIDAGLLLSAEQLSGSIKAIQRHMAAYINYKPGMLSISGIFELAKAKERTHAKQELAELVILFCKKIGEELAVSDRQINCAWAKYALLKALAVISRINDIEYDGSKSKSKRLKEALDASSAELSKPAGPAMPVALAHEGSGATGGSASAQAGAAAPELDTSEDHSQTPATVSMAAEVVALRSKEEPYAATGGTYAGVGHSMAETGPYRRPVDQGQTAPSSAAGAAVQTQTVAVVGHGIAAVMPSNEAGSGQAQTSPPRGSKAPVQTRSAIVVGHGAAAVGAPGQEAAPAPAPVEGEGKAPDLMAGW
jgi:hypothetical protein